MLKSQFYEIHYSTKQKLRTQKCQNKFILEDKYENVLNRCEIWNRWIFQNVTIQAFEF